MIEEFLAGLKEPFTLHEAHKWASSLGYSGTVDAFKMRFLRQVKKGRYLRVARDLYLSRTSGLTRYSWQYSEVAMAIALEICTQFNDLRFSLFEIRQLNEFVNHLYGQNTIFISVADRAADFVFSELQESHLGKILLRPSTEVFHQYQVDGTIVLMDMPTESPRGGSLPWQCGIEKWLVDLFSDQILKVLVSPSELVNILNGTFERYAINESTLFRYAKRRTVESVIKKFIINKTTVKLRATPC